MAIRPIVLYQWPEVAYSVLREPCVPVLEFDHELARLSRDMLDTVHHAKGVGLAANQIGVSLRVIVLHCMGVEDTLVNPVIVVPPDAKKVRSKEACLSTPGTGVWLVDRWDRIIVDYQNLEGEALENEIDGAAAMIVQHEAEHLDGKMFFDQLGQTKKRLIRERYFKYLAAHYDKAKGVLA